MTKEEKIKELKEQIFLIEVGSDYLTAKDWDMIHDLKEKIKELEND